MAEFVTVGSTSEVPEGQVMAYDIAGRRVAVARTEGSYYAFDDICTHRYCSLSDGDLDGTTIVCPCHGAEFDIRTGEVLMGPATEPVATYPVRVEGTDLQVSV